jgi:rare lipoprotein A
MAAAAQWAARRRLRIALWAPLLFASACAPARTRPSPAAEPGFLQEGIASWYGPGFEGQPTASGEVFDPRQLTAAHRTLPFGTRLRVVHVASGREVVVRINDRGPFIRGRVIDLSRAAAQRLNMITEGTARVRLHVVDVGSDRVDHEERGESGVAE